MCGIAGILNAAPSPTEHLEEKLRVLRRSLKHRGPDDEGLWVAPDGHAGLVHTRLAILDLSPGGHQPMSSADGMTCIVFNGEIYNFRALRDELEREGQVFRTQSDTEVLLKLYQRDGAAMVKKLRGMFAFCIWDALEHRALLARDPLGIKPLYYSVSGGRLAFASELRALQSAGLCGSRLNPSAVMQFFETGSVPEPLTLVEDVRCLPAGHTLTWNSGEACEQCYWRIEFPPGDVGHDEAVALTRSALLDSITHHFVSDVPVGIFLSGGIDSTAVLALAREIGQRDISTFSIGVDDAGLDESSAARERRAHFGTTAPRDCAWMRQSWGRSFPRFLSNMDQPSIDGFNTYTVSGFARQHGMKVVLSGLGGDETVWRLSEAFRKVPQLRQGSDAGCTPCRGWRRPLAGWHERYAPRLPLRRAGSFLQREPTLANAFMAFRGMFRAT
jgi:asparagine synthase (glutamine-hydrolysing)